jgi:hypothetical protein
MTFKHEACMRDHIIGVMPAQAGSHLFVTKMDSRQSLRDFGNDAKALCSGMTHMGRAA